MLQPAHLHIWRRFCAMLWATPPKLCRTQPGTDPPRRTSAAPIGKACGPDAREPRSRTMLQAQLLRTPRSRLHVHNASA